MEAEIKKETDDGFGLLVVDSNDAEHKVGVCFDGEIDGHLQDAYPDDPDKRTHSEAEYVGHARKYAQYYVAQETDYETIPWDLNADRFKDVRQALQALSTEEISHYFGELLEQSLSHYRDDPEIDVGDATRKHELPADMIGSDNAVRYKQEIYLDDSGAVDAVSGIGIAYYVARGDRTTTWHGDSPDREPDAYVDVFPAPLRDPAPFRDYLDYNLRCQIRDCYLMRGMEPPEQYRVLGHGQYRFTGKYDNFDLYPPYHEIEADIPGYSHEFRPDLPITWKELRETVDSTQGGSLYDQIKHTLFGR